MTLDRDEYIEQAYFFRSFRERVADNVPAQDVLSAIYEELLATTRLPMAVQFLGTELRHTGLLASGFARLGHYFTPFQTFVIRQAEEENQKLTMPVALLILEREAAYRADGGSPQGLFIYQLEAVSRNRLGYDEGLRAVEADTAYDANFRAFIDIVRRQIGAYDFCDLLYARSAQYILDRRRVNRDYEPSAPPVYGEKEGKIANAGRGRDPVYTFAALQRQLGYPEVPRLKAKDDISTKLEIVNLKLKELENRLKITESELRGTFDPTQLGKPDLYKSVKDDE